MDPTGGIKVHRGIQNQTPLGHLDYVQGMYNQFTHMKGSDEGNIIVSHSPVSNAMTLKIFATTDVDNTISTTLLNPEDPTSAIVHPSIQIGVYENPAIIVNEENKVGIGTFNTSIPIVSKLTIVSGNLADPGDPGSALTVYEGSSTLGKVLISNDAFGAATWGKVTKDYTTGVTQTLQVAKNGGGYYTVSIQNGLITTVTTSP